jgi:phage tail P2-like protein
MEGWKMIDIYSVSLLDLLPDSLKYDPDIQALALAITPELQSISNDIAQCILLKNIDSLPDEVLDVLAWDYHVDFYDTSLEIEQKRELIKNSIALHRKKGTPAAVEDLVTIVFGDGEVEEWFEYGGDPYHFRVLTNNASVTQDQTDLFQRALSSVKNERSWLEKIVIKMGDSMNLYVGCALHIGDNLTLKQVV